ncbi:hypothetical protein AB0B50_40275 [Streptomyces sp. NPDC041068]|uniref:hypothetical protein n=1 Tax=Streptomyces sp. NPDC041068 TaxID=3155130 RepID=UPI0033CD9275
MRKMQILDTCNTSQLIAPQAEADHSHESICTWGFVSCPEILSPHLESEVNRRFLPVAVAITASAMVLLTGCGSGSSDDDSSDKIKGAGGGDKDTSASAGASENPDRDKRPRITLPKSFQVTFDGWTNSDPKLQAILDDGKQQLLASYAAITEGDPGAAPMTFYNTGEALATGKKWISGFADKDLTLIGKTRTYKPQARISPDGSGTLFYCSDESKASTQHRKTKKVTGTPSDKAQVLYRTKLRKSSQGVWQTTFVSTTQGGCQ